MTHAVEVDGRIWAYYGSMEEAESGAKQRRAQGHAAAVVEATPYESERSFEKGAHPPSQLNLTRSARDVTDEASPFVRR